MSRTTTNQANQRAAVKQRRRFRHPDPNGETRSQGGTTFKRWAAGRPERLARVARVAALHLKDES